MKTLRDIDKNFAQEMSVDMAGRIAYDVCREPFCVHGLVLPENENDVFRRMPLEIAQSISGGITVLHEHTAGGRVRFATDSARIAICAEVSDYDTVPSFSLSGRVGMDLYEITDGTEKFRMHFQPSVKTNARVEGEYKFSDTRMRDFTLYMPSYSSVKKLLVILDEGAMIKQGKEYKHTKPVVYYGSSITQGASSSRPGTAYPNIIARKLDTDYINLGFSANAKGEVNMAKYISTLDMSICVLDYDYNAPTAEHLRKTHYPFYEIIRNAQPDLPIIFVSKPNYHTGTPKCSLAENEERRCIILESYNRARENGDKNIYFVDGKDVAGVFEADDNMTVDGCHPNDIGFLSMAKLIGDQIEQIFEGNKGV